MPEHTERIVLTDISSTAWEHPADRAAHDRALPRFDLRQIRARNQMRMKLEPAHERIAFAVFDVIRFGKTTQAGAEPVAIALPDLGKNPDPADAGSVGHAFHEVCQERFDVIESPKDAGKSQERQRIIAAMRC